MIRADRASLWAGVLPILAVNTALWINIQSGFEACFPYLEGCISVSRGVRSGPGLWLFKLSALPAAFLMWRAWAGAGDLPRPSRDLAARVIRMLGQASALFFLLYAAWLGTEGEIYAWLRRYGVVFYFGFAGIAQLLLASRLYRLAPHDAATRLHLAVVSLTWALGVASAFKRKLIDDPALLDRVENALEWHFALWLSLSFLSLAWVLRRARRNQSPASQASETGHR